MQTSSTIKIVFICLALSIAIGLSTFPAFRIYIAEEFVWGELRLENIALALNPGDAPFARHIGNYYFNVFGSGEHELKKARNAYEKALQWDSSIKGPHYQLGRIHFIEGDFYNALQEVEKEVVLHPEFPNSYYMLGLIYGFRGLPGDLNRAAQGFELFIDQVPSNWAGYNDLAWIYIKQKRYQEAIEVVELAFEKLPATKKNNVWLWTALGIAHLNTGNLSASKEALLTTERLARNVTPEYFWSAYPGNNPQNATSAFSQFTATLNFNLGVVHEKLEDWETSIGYYNKYLAQLPDGPYPTKEEIEHKLNRLYVRAQ